MIVCSSKNTSAKNHDPKMHYCISQKKSNLKGEQILWQKYSEKKTLVSKAKKKKILKIKKSNLLHISVSKSTNHDLTKT